MINREVMPRIKRNKIRTEVDRVASHAFFEQDVILLKFDRICVIKLNLNKNHDNCLN